MEATTHIKEYDSHSASAESVRRFCREFTEVEGIPPYACVLTFGCQQNEADSEKMRGVLSDLGYGITADPEQAHVLLFNTCAVRDHAEKKVLSVIGQYKHLKLRRPSLIIGVCGCMSAQEERREKLKRSYPYVDFATGPAAADKLPGLIASRLRGEKRSFAYTEEGEIFERLPVKRSEDFRAWVNIMHGCNNFCTYCIVPYVRGRERSRRKEDIIEECRSLIEGGVKEITLLGQNVNSYGRGLYTDYAFPDLLRDVCSLGGDFTVRFMTSHPKDATDELFLAMSECEKAAKHFHLPIQSGSNRILKAMNRRYTFEDYLAKVEKMRSLMPGISITSDIIVAFPGETEEDFEETLNALRAVRYDMLYSFIYSPRNGTPAASMGGQIPKDTANARFSRLLELQNAIAKEKNDAFVGKVIRVLCEGESKTDRNVYAGRSDGYKTVFFPQRKNAGEYAYVKIERADAYALYGVCVDGQAE